MLPSRRKGDRVEHLAAEGELRRAHHDMMDGTNFEVDYGSEEHATIVYKTLVVDKELQPDKVRRGMTVSGGKLAVRFEAVEARFLRASFSAFVDLMVTQAELHETLWWVKQMA
ncbi:hypothetical protein QYE76_071910 [Lolium multiflorum]|uniref:Uncharacterized protein n=1 Tax=Lolium multiflorum TaxID=4521 RepID=A0AAD8VB12_LOLMU|nr:hypothetical protein QYE76_071910 [Lolium multiflorum]